MGEDETRRLDSGEVLSEYMPFAPKPLMKLRNDLLPLSAGEESLKYCKVSQILCVIKF